MPSNLDYAALARSYEAGVRDLLAPATGGAERSAGAPATHEGAAEVAAALAETSRQLTAAAAAQLDTGNPDRRLLAGEQLLAKTLTDMEVGQALLMAAQDEADGVAWGDSALAERSGASLGEADHWLAILRGEASSSGGVERGGDLPKDVPAAKTALATEISDTLNGVTKRAAGSTQVAMTGMLSLGLAEMAKAVSVVGTPIADALGQTEHVSQLFAGVRSFGVSAYDSMAALLGPDLLRIGAAKVSEISKQVREGDKAAELLGRLFETGVTEQVLVGMVQSADASLDSIDKAFSGVATVDSGYTRQVALVDKILPKMKYVQLIPALAMPQGRLLLGAGYLALTSYVILAAADVLHAEQIRLLKRLPSVREIVEDTLTG